MLMLVLVFWVQRFLRCLADFALESDPTLPLQVVLPQSTGASIALEVGEQLPRNGSSALPRLRHLPIIITATLHPGLSGNSLKQVLSW